MLISPGISAGQEEPVYVAGEYKIGPQDLLEIRVFDRPELSQTVRVQEDGSITLPLLEKVQAAGLTVYELEKALSSLLEARWMKTAYVTVFIREYQRVSVTGAVKTPGMYQLIGQTSLLQIISMAGGLTEQAMDEIYIYRESGNGEKERITINIIDLMSNGNQSLDVALQPKDVVIVPVDQIITVYVYGEVKKPGAMQFKLSKRPTLMQAIAQAGGPTEWASSSIMITRKDRATGRERKIRVNLKELNRGKISDPELQEGDIVIVP